MRTRLIHAVLVLFLTALLPAGGPSGRVQADEPAADTRRGDGLLAEYFAAETARLETNCLDQVRTREQWESLRGEYRRQLLEMLGLDPLPSRTPLQAEVTGITEHDQFVVERLHFQSRPGLYVTANLYRPREITGPLPAVLYVCGHGRVAQDGISYGNKVAYQHHGAWFARHGYVCLTIDTLQLGEIEGIHHGTYRYAMWWWLNHGYTPAGVEAWNCIRALDYLQTRAEVDGQRLGVTGRSGGGAYSWWIAALDDRIQAAVPVAGITDLRNHVVDGCVEGHCDCMYLVNTYRWDYPLLAALVAPRPLLISNTDSDRIFPLDGVVRTFEKVRRIYGLYGAADKVALNITAGPHKDTQELRVHAFRWLNQHLRDDDRLLDKPAVKFFEPPQLKVFETLPEDQRNTEIHESFVARETPPLADSPEHWQRLRDGWRDQLLQKSFAAWPRASGANDSLAPRPSEEAAPDEAPVHSGQPADASGPANPPVPLNTVEIATARHQGLLWKTFEFTSQPHVPLRLYVVQREDLAAPKLAAPKVAAPELVVLNVLDDDSWRQFLATMRVGFESQLQDESLPPADPDSYESLKKMLQGTRWCMAYVAPRGIGPTAWDPSPRKQTQHRRRFYLLGQTLDGMRTWDVRRAVQAVRGLEPLGKSPLWLQSHRTMAGVTLYASLFEPDIRRLDLYDLPPSHREGPIFLNVSRFLDMPQALAMAAERSQVILYGDPDPAWDYATKTAAGLGWDARQLRFRKPPE